MALTTGASHLSHLLYLAEQRGTFWNGRYGPPASAEPYFPPGPPAVINKRGLGSPVLWSGNSELDSSGVGVERKRKCREIFRERSNQPLLAEEWAKARIHLLNIVLRIAGAGLPGREARLNFGVRKRKLPREVEYDSRRPSARAWGLEFAG